MMNFVKTDEQGNYKYNSREFYYEFHQSLRYIFDEKSKLIDFMNSSKSEEGGFSVEAFDLDTQKQKLLFFYPSNVEEDTFLPHWIPLKEKEEIEKEAAKQYQEYTINWQNCYKKLRDIFVEQLNKNN